MAINTGNNAKLLWPGLSTIYGITYNEYPQECLQIFETLTSNKAYEEIIGMTGFGLASIKPEGQPGTYDTESQAFLTRFSHATFFTGFIITEENMDDDQYSTIGSRRTKGLAYSVRQTKETVAANVLNRAFNTSYTGGDSSTLIASTGAGSSTHSNVSGGTWTNGPTTDADLSEAALEQAVIDIGNFKDDRGKKIQVMPRQLIIPNGSQFEAERILGSMLRVGTSDNDKNALYSMGSVPKVIVNHYLTDTDAWFVQTDIPNGMIHYERKAPVFAIDNDFDTSNAKFKVSYRESWGWGDPRCMFGSEGL